MDPRSITEVKDMARHFAPSKKKKIVLPKLRLKALPTLFPKENKSVRRKKYQRIFSAQEMILTLAATLLFIAGLLFPLPRWASLAVFGFSALLALLPLVLNLLERVLAHKLPDEDLLALIGVLASFCIGMRPPEPWAPSCTGSCRSWRAMLWPAETRGLTCCGTICRKRPAS